jgi:signal transduction histidine kinase/CheY-like chemotaxis protein/HPt (histidine-containing phosphotransfer) domain-containing protein
MKRPLEGHGYDAAVRVRRRAGALRLVAAFAAVGLSSLAMLAWVTLSLSDRAVRAQADARVKATSQAAAELVHQQMEGLGDVVQVVSRRPPLIAALGEPGGDASSAELMRAASDIRAARSHIEAAFVADSTGHLLAIDPPTGTAPGIDLSFRDWFAGARRSSSHYVSEAFVSRGTPPQTVVTASAASRDESGRIVGVIAASYSVETLQKQFGAFARTQQVLLQVTDQRGSVIAGPDYKQSLAIDRSADVTAALAGETLLSRRGDDLRVSAPVPQLGWTVTAIAPTSRVDASIRDLRRSVLGITALLAVAVGGGLALMTWSIRNSERAERQVLATEARERLLLQSTADGVLGVDGDGRCTFANPAAARLLGVDGPDDLIGDRVEQRIRAAEQVLEWDSRPLADGAGAVITVRDLSEQRLAQRELAAARDAALEASRMKSAFLANMSHEIRTPMNGVIGMTTLLADTTLDERQQEYVATIRSSSEALLDVINDILDFSKIEAGHLDIEELDYDVREMVEQVADMLASAADRKHVELILDIADDVPDAVRGDAGRVRQVVTNLLSNAVKFTDKGTITVTVRKEDGPPAQLRYEVTDTGIGIDPRRAAHLFDAFTQADVSTTRRYGGTGLGLTISRQLVELMGGAMGVDTEPGRGSSFWVHLPLVIADRPPAALPQRADLQGVNALIVDDNQVNRRVLAEMLARWGMRSESVESPVDAIEAVRAASAAGRPFDIALLDYHMPEMDGVELARRLGADEAAAGTRLVMLTSSAGRDETAAAVDAGIVGYVTKPVRRGALYSLLTKAMSRGAAATDGAAAAQPVVDRVVPRRLLVVEDNPINQRVAVHLLEKYGHDVDVAGDGREALDAMAAVDYDVVFMDVQMPELDGYGATIEQRGRERATGGARTPIVALTAGATREDVERCIASGMDDVVTKPVSEEELLASVSRWAERQVVTIGDTRDLGDKIDGGALDALVAIDPDGSKGVLDRLATSFLHEAQVRVAELRDGVRTGDADTVRRAAHRLKGSSLYFGTIEVTNLCRVLEERGEDGALGGCAEVVDRLGVEVAWLDGVLQPEIARRQANGVVPRS